MCICKQKDTTYQSPTMAPQMSIPKDPLRMILYAAGVIEEIEEQSRRRRAALRRREMQEIHQNERNKNQQYQQQQMKKATRRREWVKSHQHSEREGALNHHRQLVLSEEKAHNEPMPDIPHDPQLPSTSSSVGQHYSSSSSQDHIGGYSLMPEAVRRCVEQQLEGSDVGLVIEKYLSATDVKKSQCRLSLPMSKITNRRFLTEEEKARLDLRDPRTNSPNPIPVTLLQPNLIPIPINFKKWDMPKPSGSVSSSYVLVTAWNDVVAANKLKEGQLIRLWSFRCEGRLSFALVIVPAAGTHA